MAVEEEEQKCPDCPACLPAYLATFADLMSLLMCFFVLLLSFAELDVKIQTVGRFYEICLWCASPN